MTILNKGKWDARTYDQISRLVQYRWGIQVLKWRKWRGDEIVMDAGCGSGLLTKQLAKCVPRGKVYGVDIDSNMIKQAKNNLQFFDNVEVIQSSFIDIKLPRKLDVIFSNSALHWIQDHRIAFQNFWEMLKPIDDDANSTDTKGCSNSNDTRNSGGQLLIQCGGYRNLQKVISTLERLTHSDRFKVHFTDWKQTWYFANIEDTSKLLQKIGYLNTKVYSNTDCVVLPNRQLYSKFIKTVVMKPYLDHLSSDNYDKEIDKLKAMFLEVFLDHVDRRRTKSDTRWFLDFVRLNIIAHRS
ncbi:MAG TPA: methyltransferase domain-containing protein [Nitrososphaeraceae archaeon]|jgi:trans-aconitate methyltransferase